VGRGSVDIDLDGYSMGTDDFFDRDRSRANVPPCRWWGAAGDTWPTGDGCDTGRTM